MLNELSPTPSLLCSNATLSSFYSSSTLVPLIWPWFSLPLPCSFIFHNPCCFPLIWLPASLRSPSPWSKVIKQNQVPHVLLQTPTCSAEIWLMSLLHPWLYSSTGQRVSFDLHSVEGYLSCSLSWSDLPDGWSSIHACSGLFHFFLHLICGLLSLGNNFPLRCQYVSLQMHTSVY